MKTYSAADLADLAYKKIKIPGLTMRFQYFPMSKEGEILFVQGAPLFYQDDIAGEMQKIVRLFLHGLPLEIEEFTILQEYILQWCAPFSLNPYFEQDDTKRYFELLLNIEQADSQPELKSACERLQEEFQVNPF